MAGAPARSSADGFDAIVLAGGPHAGAKVLGLTLVERARRVVGKLGARRTLIVDDSTTAAEIVAWAAGRAGAAVLVVRGRDQVVSRGLGAPLVAGAATGARRVAVDGAGAYLGALWAGPAEAGALIEAVAAGAGPDGFDDRGHAAAWLAEDAVAVTAEAIASHPARDRAERRGATRMLLGLITKGEDGPVTRYVYRPVSRPVTRLLVHTPISPNQVSIAVGIIGLIGCWFVAQPSQASLILGMGLILAAGFIDGCDGELARLRLQFSPIGAWLDTIIDELTTTVSFVALGIHCVRGSDLAWLPASIWVGLVAYLATIYVIYFFLIVVSKTGNSQHYAGKLDVVDDASGRGLRVVPSKPLPLPPWLVRATAFIPHIIRRDFINLGSFVLALVNLYLINYTIMLVGGVVTILVIGPEHLRLRGQLRRLRALGVSPALLPAAPRPSTPAPAARP